MSFEIICIFSNYLDILLGVRPGTLQNFHLESHRMVPTPLMLNRQSQSVKSRQYVLRIKINK